MCSMLFDRGKHQALSGLLHLLVALMLKADGQNHCHDRSEVCASERVQALNVVSRVHASCKGSITNNSNLAS